MSVNGFTPTQIRMLEILSDGLPHTRKELHACLNDELGPIANIRPHITYLRRHLRPKGEDIVCEIAYRKVYYRHVRLLVRG